MDEQGIFGYCERCGLVYALKDRMTEQGGEKKAGGPSVGFRKEGTKDTIETRSSVRESTEKQDRTPHSHWRCPDCDAEIDSENESDLDFAKREHIREYHPNRVAG